MEGMLAVLEHPFGRTEAIQGTQGIVEAGRTGEIKVAGFGTSKYSVAL